MCRRCSWRTADCSSEMSEMYFTMHKIFTYCPTHVLKLSGMRLYFQTFDLTLPPGSLEFHAYRLILSYHRKKGLSPIEHSRTSVLYCVKIARTLCTCVQPHESNGLRAALRSPGCSLRASNGGCVCRRTTPSRAPSHAHLRSGTQRRAVPE